MPAARNIVFAQSAANPCRTWPNISKCTAALNRTGGFFYFIYLGLFLVLSLTNVDTKFYGTKAVLWNGILLHMLENHIKKLFVAFLDSRGNSHCFCFIFCRCHTHRCHQFNYFGQYIKYSGKKYSFTLLLVEKKVGSGSDIR